MRLTAINLTLAAILLLALLIRLPGVPYGLPDHLIGDEEVNVYSALQMIQLKTLLPVLHPDEFRLLYQPPMLSFVYTIFFVPILAFMYLRAGMPTTDVFADILILDPSALWIMGRLVNIGISLASVFLIYRIGMYLFGSRTAATASAFLLATSFIDATLAATTRHWALGTFFSLLSLFLVLRYVHHPAKPLSLLALAGAVLGLSFGTSYLVYYLPFIGLLVLYFFWKESQTLRPDAYLRPALYFGIPFAVVGALLIAVAPQPFTQQVVNHVYAGRHTPIQFLWFYLQTLLNYETPLLITSLVGFFALWKNKQRELLLIFGAFFVTVLPIMFVFLWDLERYIQPLLPIFALMGGYGISEFLQRFPGKKTATILLLLLLIYTAFVFGRYAVLALRDDTKMLAKQWIHENIPAQSLLLVDSERLRFRTTPAAAEYLQSIDPSYLRATDRMILERERLENDSYHAFHMFLVPPEKQKGMLSKALAFPAVNKYVVTDTWSFTHVMQLIREGEPLASFSNGSTTLVPIGLYIGGEEHTNTSAHILQLLWTTDYFGPDVYVYKLE